MKRCFFNLAAAVSLVLCVALAALWVRSHSQFEFLGWQTFMPNGDKFIDASSGIYSGSRAGGGTGAAVRHSTWEHFARA